MYFMANKKKSDRFDLKDTPYDLGDDVLSTDLSYNGDKDIYRKYKLKFHQEIDLSTLWKLRIVFNLIHKEGKIKIIDNQKKK